jgi:hypothetical protein
MMSPASDPPKLLILPKNPSPEARICTLGHPRTSNPSRYYFDPEKGIYEFTRIAAPKHVYRSWLIGGKSPRIQSKDRSGSLGTSIPSTPDVKTGNSGAAPPNNGFKDSGAKPISDGYVLKNAELLIATPIDYLFLLLPSLANTTSAKSSSKELFLSADDHIEKLVDKSEHLVQISSHGTARAAMEERMQAVCDSVDAGDEKMYRLNDDKLLDELVIKAKKMVEKGLPASMEERFIRKALDTPIMVVKHEDSSVSETNASQGDALPSGSTSFDAADSQASTATSVSTTSVSTEVTIPDDPASATENTELFHLLRIRTALSYMISAYIPPTYATILYTMLGSDKSPVNFKPLDERLASLAKVRAEALAARSLGDFSRKRSMYEEDDAVESRAEKKRLKEDEEKKKKAGETRGLRDLKKVDTKGMKKMSDFFGKSIAVKKR